MVHETADPVNSTRGRAVAEELTIVNLTTGLNLRELLPLMWAELCWSNYGDTRLFVYGGIPVRLRPSEQGCAIEPLTEARLRHELVRCELRFERRALPVPPPQVIVQTMLADPEPPLPALKRIVRAPVFTKMGAILAATGYDWASEIYCTAKLGAFNVPAQPSRADIEKACHLLLDDLLVDFPFTGPSERAHALAACLLPFVRELVTGPTPLHLIEKSTPGTGATLCAEMLAYPALGRAVPLMTVARDEDEQRRTLTAKLLGAPDALLLDNLPISRTLDSAALSAALTCDTWEDRFISSSSVVSLPVRCVWMATANNPRLSHELSRRTVRIRLDAGVEKPWLRTRFKHPDIRQWAATHRAELIAALLTLVRAWFVAGQPEGSKVLGMYESWSRTLGGILDVAGVEGFLGNLREHYEAADSETVAWSAFVSSWWATHKSAVVGIADLHTLAARIDDLGITTDTDETTSRANRLQLGNLLRDRKDRVFAGHRIIKAGEKQGAARWRLEPVNVEAQS